MSDTGHLFCSIDRLPSRRSFISSSNRHRIGRHRKGRGEFRDCAHIFASDELTDCTHVVLPRKCLGATPGSIGKLNYGLGRMRSAPIQIILPPLPGQSPVKCPLPDIGLAPTSKGAQRVNKSASLEECCDGQIRQPIKILGDINTLVSVAEKCCRAITDCDIAGREETQFSEN